MHINILLSPGCIVVASNGGRERKLLKTKSSVALRAAIALQQVHGTRFAAAFLADWGVPIDIALDLLVCVDKDRTSTLTSQPHTHCVS